MENFLTGITSKGPTFTLPIVIILNAILLTSAIITISYTRKNPADKRLLRILAILQTIEYFSVVIWYYAVDYMAFPMPLYHCRLAKLMLIFLTFTESYDKLRTIFVYSIPLGVLGAISSFLVPNPDPFPFPHITQFGFFFGHFNLMLFAITMLSFTRKRFTRKDFFRGQGLVFLINIVVAIIARLSKMNYSYMLEAPLFKETLLKWHPVPYTLLIFGVYFVLFSISFFVISGLQQTVYKNQLID